MTKQELLDKLAEKYHKVAVVQQIREEAGIKKYIAGIYRVSAEGSLVRENKSFYVENEGTADEVAYWEMREPDVAPVIVETFAEKVKAKIKEKIDAGEADYVRVIDMDEKAERALVEAILPDGTVKKIVGYEDADGNLVTKEVIS